LHAILAPERIVARLDRHGKDKRESVLTEHHQWTSGLQTSMIEALGRAVSSWGERQFLDFLGQTYTYRDLDKIANRFANQLIHLGVAKGDTVVSFLDNSADAVFAIFGVAKAGAISVPINTANRGEFLRHQVADAGAKVVIAESEYVERLLQIADAITDVELILYRGARPNMGDSTIRCEPLDAHRGQDDSPPNIKIKPGDLAFLIYTSGTTGPAKGCMISHNFVCSLARQSNWIYKITEKDVMWTPLPLFHLNAIAVSMMAAMLVGGRVAIVPRFSVTNFWPEIERSGATMASVLGTMATLIARAADNPSTQKCYGQLKSVQGAPWPADIVKIWQERFGIRNHLAARLYGISEASVVTTVQYDVEVPPGSSGRRNPEFEVRIVDDDDNELPPGVPGEVICRPLMPHVTFEGYWRRPEETLKIMKNMWLHMGDIGKFDEQGFFYFVDRKKDYLRRRGENVSSFEMEAAIGKHPAIAEVAVHAVPSELSEDDIKVTAVLNPETVLTEEELCRWTLDKVPYFAVPRYIEFRDSLPRNPVGRVLKYQLRDEGKTPRTWDIEQSDIVVTKR